MAYVILCGYIFETSHTPTSGWIKVIFFFFSPIHCTVRVNEVFLFFLFFFLFNYIINAAHITLLSRTAHKSTYPSLVRAITVGTAAGGR